jgi:hypothetical protein
VPEVIRLAATDRLAGRAAPDGAGDLLHIGYALHRSETEGHADAPARQEANWAAFSMSAAEAMLSWSPIW